MHYVYLLYSSKTGKHYVGQTSNLKERIKAHNSGSNQATKTGVPWKIVYYEAFPTKSDAVKREKRLKHHGKGLSELKKRITIINH